MKVGTILCSFPLILQRLKQTEMAIICATPGKRPPNVNYSSMAELFERFETLFLGGTTTDIDSTCGHRVSVFDHHFFHMVGITKGDHTERLFMREEKHTIRNTTTGFGPYSIAPKGSRAKHLQSAYEALVGPDEVWEDNPGAMAKWVYLKEYDSVPYPFSVVLVTERPEEGLIVPVTGFPCKKGDLKKWRQGKRIYP